MLTQTLAGILAFNLLSAVVIGVIGLNKKKLNSSPSTAKKIVTSFTGILLGGITGLILTALIYVSKHLP